MQTYRFPINGLRHHDYGDRLDELYELAPGRRMSISIEHDNPAEPDAVTAYLGKDLVGYVRSGSTRECACSLIKASGRGALMGKVVDVDREKRWLWLEVASQCQVPPAAETEPTVLNGWNFDGELLPCDEAELRLHTLICNLETTLEGQEPWDDDMELWLEYVEQNLWRDISRETYFQMKRLLDLTTSGGDAHPEYKQKNDRLQTAIDAMGSPQVRLAQATQIIQKASSKDMDILLLHYGDTAMENIQKLPKVIVALFQKDGELLMAKLWYRHRPHQQIQAVSTLLAMWVRLQSDGGGAKPQPSIPIAWIMAWAERQKDKVKAEVVKDIISSFELEQSNPQLAQQLQQMQDGCDTGRMQAEALKEVASTPKTNNFYKDSVSVNAGATLMGNIHSNPQ